METNENKKDIKIKENIISNSKNTKTTKKNNNKSVLDVEKNLKVNKLKTSKTTIKTSEDTKKSISSKKQSKKHTSIVNSDFKKTSSRKTKLINKPAVKSMLSEYYDLPYRYNQTIVKILAQTPTTLFVYWDISDEDRNSLISLHGENFFFETRPVLIVHNLTHNYCFEIAINDFANSWYIRTQEPNCTYVIELGRKFYNINKNEEEYIYINSSNNIISPNDHVLFEQTNLKNLLFKNVKTNEFYSKDFGDLNYLDDINKLYGNIYDIYSAIYNEELFNELKNPSSSEFYLKK